MTEAEIEQAISRVSSSSVLKLEHEGGGNCLVSLKGKSREWSVRLELPSNFPHKLPDAVLLNKEVIGLIPHVNRKGVICLESSDSLWVDHTRPTEIITHFLESVCEDLDRFSLSIYQDELLDEYEGYFLVPTIFNSVNSFYQAGDEVETPRLLIHKQSVRRNPESIKPVLIHPEGSSIPRNFSNANVSERLTASAIIHLPLDEAVLPPRNAEQLSGEYIFDLKKNVAPKNIKRLEKQLKKKGVNYWAFVLISMPRTDGNRTQLLLRFSASKPLPHPLAEKNDDWKVDVFRLNQLSQEYLLERGGSDCSLQNIHIAVIGCGSVGGEVAYMLAKAGCGRLTLIDDELFEPDNIYRHRLGGRYLNFKPNDNGVVASISKVDALKSSLTKDLPCVQVSAIPKQLNQSDSSALPKDIDLAVVAVGSPTESTIINHILKDSGIHKAVFCWNEASSIGGHAIALDLNSSCYECLHSGPNGLRPKTILSLVEPGQVITKNLTGCAGVFTPFSYLDSVRTAELAAQLAINLISKNEHSIARSWKGAGSDNVKTTERYDTMAERETSELCSSAHCGVCNG